MGCQNPGIFRTIAHDFNISFDEIDLHAGDQIPDLVNYDALWVMGGSMNVWEEEEFPWLKQEKEIIREVVNELSMPFLGICLGHQLLAEALGGRVGPSSAFEVGIYPITPTKAGINHPLLANLPESPGWANVHSAEVTELPPNATILARSNRCLNHVMQVNARTYSCQFHPEVCETTLRDWMAIPGIVEFLIDLMGNDKFEAFKQDIETKRPDLEHAARQLFVNWINLTWPR